jgi:hypothetical protein
MGNVLTEFIIERPHDPPVANFSERFSHKDPDIHANSEVGIGGKNGLCSLGSVQ